MSDDVTPVDESAQGFFWSAVACAAFADSATAVFGRDAGSKPGTRRLETHYAHVRGLVLAQGVELAAKSWFIQHGVSAEALRRRSFGHDLQLLFERAIDAGFPPCGEAEQRLLAALNDAYREPKELQNPQPRAATPPSPLATREFLHETLRLTCAEIYPSVDMERIRLAADPGRWIGLRTDAFALYTGSSLAELRDPAIATPPAAPEPDRVEAEPTPT